MNRVSLVEFENLKYEDYKEIAKDDFEKIAKYFEEEYGIQVIVDGMIDGAAKRAEKINQGSRPIIRDMHNSFNNILLAKIKEDKIGKKKQGLFQTLRAKIRKDETEKNAEGKTFSAFYDSDKDEFQIFEINKDGEIVSTTKAGIVFQAELDEQIRKEKALEDANKSKEEKAPEEIDLEKMLANFNIEGAIAS